MQPPPGWHWPQHEALIEKFQWKQNVTPCSSLLFVALSIVGYLAVIFLLQFLLRPRKNPVPLGYLPALHNLNLCLGSLVMFLGALQAALVDSEENQWMWGSENKYRWLLCFPVGTKPVGRVFFWSYVYYLSKFYELLDTVVLVLRKKRLSLLHVYHHCTVIIMCYLWMQGQQSLQTLGLLTNTGIHVVMYLYYFLHSIGMPPPWRKFVTNGQITQFCFSFIASLPFLWLHFSKGGGCAGFSAWLFNVAFNLSLLYLFVDFHRKQYGAKKEARQNNVKKTS
eukprot:TRINITY_DN33082_c0_g1_i1.p1 TRINITY_DN33082_c0_g1~~TRINITY_DN33082_c0_g1_i1.p1  ORF type:complete len:280 (-),score=30.19 TRINITY_DN33082_c0_g1_i1:342-1181(-)